jgi:hypothetical protein
MHPPPAFELFQTLVSPRVITRGGDRVHHHQHGGFGVRHAIDRRNVGEVGNQPDHEGDRRDNREDRRGVPSNKLEETRDRSTSRTGVGALCHCHQNVAKEAGLRRVWLVTTNDNLDALRFNQRRGLRIVNVGPARWTPTCWNGCGSRRGRTVARGWNVRRF